ncbi:TPA: fimbrial protein [Salmonella enterica]|nr:fimbrial protein [Salmonella enterica]
MKMSGWRAVVSLAGILVFCRSTGVLADVPITVTGTVVEPACSVVDANGNDQTEVDFGVIPLEKVGTARAQQSLRMKVTCDSAAPSGKSLKMFIRPTSAGTMSYNNRTVLGTTIAGLGIDLMDSSNHPVAPSTWEGVGTQVSFPSGDVTLQAMLVSPDTSALTVGDFSATASVMMSYM